MKNADMMHAIADGDYTSSSLLFRTYYQSLCQQVYALIGNEESSEDIVQDIFTKLWQNRKKIVITEDIAAYLRQMTKHAALNHLRSQSRAQRMDDTLQMEQLTYVEHPMEAAELRIALVDCINQLSHRTRQVLIASRVEEKRLQEISDQYSISIKTTKNLLWMALRKLKFCLEQKGL